MAVLWTCKTNITVIRADIRMTMAIEMKSEKGHFCDSIRDDLKKKLADIRKLSKVITDLKTTTDGVGEANFRELWSHHLREVQVHHLH